MDQLVVLQEIFESYMRGGFSRAIDPKSISGDCANLVAALLESFEDGQIDEKICIKLLNCLSDIYDIKRLGDICRLAGHLGIAARCYNKALSQTTDQHVKSVLFNNLGQVHARQGYLGRALHYYERAAEGFSTLGDVGSLAHVLGNMGSAYRSGQNYDKAIESCRKSLEIFKSLDDEFGVAQMTGSLGRIYAEMGDFDLALQYYEKSLADFEGLGDQRQVAWLLNRMGRVNAEMNDWDVSIGYYNKSMEIFEGIGQNHNAGVVLSNLGRLYLDRGDYDLASDHLEMSLDLIRKSMQPVRANAVSWLSAVRSIQGRELHQQALHQIAGGGTDRDARELFDLASSNYAGASDCYLELARTPGVGLPDLEIDAGIARFASAFVILEMETEPEKAVKLAEEGVSALNSALSNAEDDSKRPCVEALRRSMMGMKETWRLALTKDEPWKLSDVVADTIEHFTQAILQLGSAGRGCKEACGHLLPAFKTLGRFMTAKLKGESPTDLSETAVYLKRAESAFELAAPDLGMISPFQIREARLMVKRLEEISGGGKAETGLLLETYQKALLLMGRVLTRSALTETAQLEIVRTWNESMNLIEESSPGKPKSRTSIPGEREHVPTASKEPESFDAQDQILEYEYLRDEGTEVRSPIIHSIDDVISSKDALSVKASAESAKMSEFPEGDMTGALGPKAVIEVETGQISPFEIPDPSESDEEVSMGAACSDLAVAKAYRRTPLKSLSRFASGLAADLGGLASRKAEFKTPRLQRQSHKALLEFLVWRGFRLFAALVFLYLLIDLTHYFI
jgi:tetratricopeptide (TPR) repeat protein